MISEGNDMISTAQFSPPNDLASISAARSAAGITLSQALKWQISTYPLARNEKIWDLVLKTQQHPWSEIWWDKKLKTFSWWACSAQRAPLTWMFWKETSSSSQSCNKTNKHKISDMFGFYDQISKKNWMLLVNAFSWHHTIIARRSCRPTAIICHAKFIPHQQEKSQA